MIVDPKLVQDLKDFIAETLPGTSIVFKDEEGWYKTCFSTYVAWLFVSIVGFFSPTFKVTFMARISNGLQGKVLVFPTRERYSDWSIPSVFEIVCHEVVHLLDQRRFPIWFPLSYTTILPVGLSMRAYWELRGYTASMLAHFRVYGEIPDSMVEFVANQFTNSLYFWMFPFPSKIREILEGKRAAILSGDISGFAP